MGRWGRFFGLGLILTVGCHFAAIAASRITLMAGPWARSVEMQDLRSLADTGEVSGFLQDALRYSNLQPQTVRNVLTFPVPFSQQFADRLFYSPVGTIVLDRMGQILAPRSSGQNGRQALRGAILRSLEQDNRLTLLEVLENYPTEARLDLQQIQQLQQDLAFLGRLPF